MKNRLLHENLDTSFVNLSALLKYLRRRQFAGSVRVELAGYEAEIILAGENEMLVREHDRTAGRIAEGEDALQRLLIRARESGGTINVYQAIEETAAPTFEKSEIIGAEKFVAGNNEIIAKPPHKNGNSKLPKIETPPVEENFAPPNPAKLPFEFTNRVEVRAKQTGASPQEWQTLVNLTAELLAAVDRPLAEASLDFTAAFEKARMEVAGDYPFLHPASDIFDYRDGKIIVRRQINAKLFAASINEVLRRILEKLGRNPKFSNVHRIIRQSILTLIKRRKPLYDKFSITPPLEKIIGAK
ncbi:MAG: hypothetical protein ACR2HG_14980 [Pyrinomonadaceae bacterium]